MSKSDFFTKDNQQKRLVRLTSDLFECWYDENQCSNEIEEDDMVEIFESPSCKELQFKIKVPGLYKWHNSYVNATDFTETTTDESFDYKQYNRQGSAFARLIRNLLPKEFDVEYQYAYEDKSHHCDIIPIPKSSASQLIYDAVDLLERNNVNNKAEYMRNIFRFIDLCPNRKIFEMYTEVRWLEEEVDILWNNSRLDCCASIGLKDFNYHIWHGNNHASKEDDCFSNGVGGNDLEDEDFAFWFYDTLDSIFEHDSKEIFRNK